MHSSKIYIFSNQNCKLYVFASFFHNFVEGNKLIKNDLHYRNPQLRFNYYSACYVLTELYSVQRHIKIYIIMLVGYTICIILYSIILNN